MNFISRDLGDSGTESVQTICVDQFCQDHSINHIDLMKLDIQGHEHSALEGAERLVRSGHIGIIFLKLNWAKSTGATCAATESIRLLSREAIGSQGKRLNWQKAGDWLRTLSDVVAHRDRPSKLFQRP